MTISKLGDICKKFSLNSDTLNFTFHFFKCFMMEKKTIPDVTYIEYHSFCVYKSCFNIIRIANKEYSGFIRQKIET